jgi:hypothetical protein
MTVDTLEVMTLDTHMAMTLDIHMAMTLGIHMAMMLDIQEEVIMAVVVIAVAAVMVVVIAVAAAVIDGQMTCGRDNNLIKSISEHLLGLHPFIFLLFLFLVLLTCHQLRQQLFLLRLLDNNLLGFSRLLLDFLFSHDIVNRQLMVMVRCVVCLQLVQRLQVGFHVC